MEAHNSQVEHKIKDMATQFSNEALKFLRGLKKNNDREWFGERKDVYEKQLKTPMLALIDEVNHAMLEFAPEHVRPAAEDHDADLSRYSFQQRQAAI